MSKIWLIAKWLLKQARPYSVKIFGIMFIKIILSFCGVGMALASKEMIDSATKEGWQKALISIYFMIAIIILQTVLQALVSLLAVHTSETMSNLLRQKIYQHLTKVKWKDITKYHSGDILTRMTNDIGTVTDGVMEILPEIIAFGTGLLASFITLLILEPVIAVYVILLIPVGLILSRLIGKRFMKIHMRMKESESSFRSYLQECLVNMLVIKSFCYEKRSEERLRELQDIKKKYVMHSSYTSVSAKSIITCGYWLSYFVIFAWGAFGLSSGTTTFGTFAAFLQLVGQIQQPFMGLAQTLPQTVSVAASAKRIMEYEGLEEEINNADIRREEFDYLKINEVSFEYNMGSPVINNGSASIKEGEIIGLVGPSGEGKTTLLHLLMSFYRPNKGDICMYNQHGRKHELNRSIRNLISYVPQGNTLFSGTIAYNLSIGNPMATREMMLKAVYTADAWDYIRKLPEGLDTVIGERGTGLSMGQAQRIAIARALLRETPILLLDEAMSALDMESEHKILRAISSLEPRRTCIIISHRPSLLTICNRVWSLNKGVLEEIESYSTVAVANEVI